MPVWQTVVIYVVVPLAIVLFLAALTLPGGRRGVRWKSGQPWEYDPVWYEPHPEALGLHPAEEHGDGHGAPALGAGHGAAALESGSAPAAVIDAGATAGDAPRPIAGGPLGGARGTW